MARGGRCLARLASGARAYVAAVLLNLALLNTTLSAPPRRSVVQVRVVAAAGPFRPTEILAGPGGEPAGVLALPLPDCRATTTASLN